MRAQCTTISLILYLMDYNGLCWNFWKEKMIEVGALQITSSAHNHCMFFELKLNSCVMCAKADDHGYTEAIVL